VERIYTHNLHALSNPFDVVGARAAGLNAIWVDRDGKGWQDKLGKEPNVIVRELGEVVQAVTKILQEQASGSKSETVQSATKEG
jgi:hypothetical protein